VHVVLGRRKDEQPPDEGARTDGDLDPVDRRIRDEMTGAADAIAALHSELRSTTSAGSEGAAPTVYGERLGLLLGRRLEEVEGAVAVAMALAERTGDELHEATRVLADELVVVAATARQAADGQRRHDTHELEARLDEVHRRIDAVTRELRAGVASLERHHRLLPAPYGERLALTLGKRLQQVEGAVAVTTELAERTAAEMRDELADVAAAGESRRRALAAELTDLTVRLERIEQDEATDLASLAAGWRAELHALDVRLGDELVALRVEMQKGERTDPKTDLALRELIARIEVVEGDRDAITAQLVRSAETWAAERIALQERVAELAARIVTGPLAVPDPGDGTASAWPTARAFDQLRINVEGLRMRLAYHEKAVAELAEGRDVDDRIDDMQRLLGQLETAGRRVRGESDTVVDQLASIAARMDMSLQRLETDPD
jgi:hypothetical protein